MEAAIQSMSTTYGEDSDDKNVETVMQAVAAFSKLVQ